MIILKRNCHFTYTIRLELAMAIIPLGVVRVMFPLAKVVQYFKRCTGNPIAVLSSTSTASLSTDESTKEKPSSWTAIENSL